MGPLGGIWYEMLINWTQYWDLLNGNVWGSGHEYVMQVDNMRGKHGLPCASSSGVWPRAVLIMLSRLYSKHKIQGRTGTRKGYDLCLQLLFQNTYSLT